MEFPNKDKILEEVEAISSKSITWASLAAVFRASRSYIHGDGVIARTYGAFGATLFAATGFFGLARVGEIVRETDDVYNYIVSGFVNGGLFGALAKNRNIVVTTLLGTGFGALYKIGGGWLYDTSKETWMDHRRFQLHNSQERKLVVTRPSFSPNRQEYDLKNVFDNKKEGKKE